MYRMMFKAQGVYPDEIIAEHVRRNTAAHNHLVQAAPHGIPLAVVGGGRSALERLGELKGFYGHIWAINQTAQWLASEGIVDNVWMFSISPTPRVATYTQGIKRAILASQCNPQTFEALADAEVGMFELIGSPASVGATIFTSAMLGYEDVTYYGCEGSFEKDVYFYRKEHRKDQIIVRCQSKDYVTTPDLYITTQHLAHAMNTFPERMKERSGGLLTAMREHPDEWMVVALSESLKDSPDAKPYEPNKKPCRIEFSVVGLVSTETYDAQARENTAAAWPVLERRDLHDTPLAIVGGGPSTWDYLEELKEWKGDIWAINQSASWLSHYAPKANVFLFSVDPDEVLAEPIFTAGVQKAILGSGCHPKLFEALRGKDVRMFHSRPIEGMELTVLGGGPCSAARAHMQAAWQGYKTVTFYGCEGSFGATTHAYRNETRPNQMIVRAGGKDYRTTPDMYINTQYLAHEIRQYSSPDKSYPYGLKEKSGGLLRAMLEYPDTWEIVALSEAMKNRFDPTALPYERAA